MNTMNTTELLEELLEELPLPPVVIVPTDRFGRITDVIDKALILTSKRELMLSVDMQNVLLDIRLIVAEAKLN